MKEKIQYFSYIGLSGRDKEIWGFGLRIPALFVSQPRLRPRPPGEGIIVQALAPENLSLAATLVYPYKKITQGLVKRKITIPPKKFSWKLTP
jgi:hypothetical protein